MHTVMVLSGGFVLLAIFCGIGWFRAREAGLGRAVQLFIPVWFVAALVNMAVGVLGAGYTVMEELPILLVIFAIPAEVAWLLGRRFERTRPGG
ncbi:hypothetical protein ACUNV4_24550 [Granulosicoccus sp. 3-233]|uniref:hypothetical protein n=1 Tax=Granulosicoccus sp. 3-233 TaxID=3417969 RepID=UPI003D32D073